MQEKGTKNTGAGEEQSSIMAIKGRLARNLLFELLEFRTEEELEKKLSK
jgi:hypothetical protein